MKDNESVYMAGNGRIACVYHQGDPVSVFGPPYSSPSPFSGRLLLPEGTERTAPCRLPKTGIWQISLTSQGEAYATVTDFALADCPCLVRHVETTRPVSLEIGACSGQTDLFAYEIAADKSHPEEGFLLKTKNGNPVYNDYPLPFPQFYRLIVKGDGTLERKAPYLYEVTVTGTAEFLIVGGPSCPECDDCAAYVMTASYQTMLDGASAFWANEFSQVNIASVTPANFPERERFLKAVDDTVVNLIIQQSAEGGVLAGYPFHLGYIRDQFGVFRCLLRLGLRNRARMILQFYVDTFRRSGKVLNAQGLGVPGLFHFAENDATEITGYLLLQFFLYAEDTGDASLLRDNTDFLLWLFRRQESQLHHGMMPFNGDETYIAGGLLPRDVIDEGSAEATMLFLLSGRRLMRFLAAEKPDLCDLSAAEALLEDAENHYRENFVINGKYTLNNPARLENLTEPPVRYGVCMNLGGREGCEFFGWTSLCAPGVYVCRKCRSAGFIPEKIRKSFYLPSALLMPAYLDSPLPGDDVLTDTLQTLAAKMSRDGFLYSDEPNRKNIGYDYGLLLINYLKYDLPGKEQVYRKILDLADDVGTWAERYYEDRPDGCRFRPWESAINVDAMIRYCLQYR